MKRGGRGTPLLPCIQDVEDSLKRWSLFWIVIPALKKREEKKRKLAIVEEGRGEERGGGGEERHLNDEVREGVVGIDLTRPQSVLPDLHDQLKRTALHFREGRGREEGERYTSCLGRGRAWW